MDLLIEGKDLTYGAGGRVLAEGLSFRLRSGQMLHISGPNGAGKSTLLRVILGLVKPLAGKVISHVERVAILPQLQNSHFHLPISLRDVVQIGVGTGPTDQEIVRLGLLETRHLTLGWNDASGGERKRALLTRALLQRPELMILDEPMNHLDKESRTIIERSLTSYLRSGASSRSGIAMVSHHELGAGDVEVVRVALGDRLEEEG